MIHVWYLGYGSNLHEQRFLCYIKGGIPQYGKICNKGCTDKTSPMEDRAMTISYPLYFALPNGETGTRNWGAGGVAFINPQEDKRSKTLCRMWKITEGQYLEVKQQEGVRWYNKEICLGDVDGIPIFTITHDSVLTNVVRPSDTYVRTIAAGLTETYQFSGEQTVDYLLDKAGIRNAIEKEYLRKAAVLKC